MAINVGRRLWRRRSSSRSGFVAREPVDFAEPYQQLRRLVVVGPAGFGEALVDEAPIGVTA
ncbi:hypothetical protein ACTMTI_23525 [Nonomuraea sp. H19]|uniref:hypothetical protein n=1 Tax=Nonomuraea sp. H19 TaxID=3452206 RepID=UPI003F8CD303